MLRPRPRSLLNIFLNPATSSRLWLLLILVVAGALRLQNLPAIEHNVDHAYPIWQGLMTLEQGYLPLTAQGTSVLFANPALTGYLYLPALMASRSPFSVYLWVITLNTLGMWFTYAAGRDLFGDRVGLIAALLMALNPWMIEYSRTSWVQALLPFWGPLVFWLFASVWVGSTLRLGRRFLFGCAALAMMTQTYLLAFAALVPVGLLSFLYRRRIGWRTLVVGAFLILIPTALYGASLLSDSASAASKLQEFGQGGARFSTEAWIHAVRLVTGHEYAASRGLNAPIRDAVLRFNLSEIAHYILMGALIAGAVIILRRTRQDPRALITLIWFVLPPLMMSYVSRPVHPFYLLLTLPAGHLLAGMGLEQTGRLLKGAAPRLSVAVGLAVVIGFGVLCTFNVVRYAEESLATPGIDGLTALPVGVGVEMTRKAILPGLRPGQVVFADVDSWILNSLSGRLFEVDRDVNIALTQHYPAQGGKYLFFHPAQTPLPLDYPDDLLSIFSLPDGTWIESYPIDTGVPDHLRMRLNLPSDRGVTLWAAQFDEELLPGTAVNLRLALKITDLPSERVQWLFGPFAHLYDATGQRILIADGAVLPGWGWRQDEVQIKRLTLNIPAGAQPPFQVRVGLYDGVHGLSALFTLPDGTQEAAVPLK